MENYLNSASEGRLIGVVETEILEKRETVLLEKEGSGLRVLLANDKVKRTYGRGSEKERKTGEQRSGGV